MQKYHWLDNLKNKHYFSQFQRLEFKTVVPASQVSEGNPHVAESLQENPSTSRLRELLPFSNPSPSSQSYSPNDQPVDTPRFFMW